MSNESNAAGGTLLTDPPAAQQKGSAGAAEPPAPDVPAWIKDLPDALTYKTDKGEIKVRDSASLRKFKDSASIAKAYLELEHFRGNSVRIPGENATPEEINEFHTRLGRPAKPDDYKIEWPKDHDGLLVREDLEKKFRQFAYERGLPDKVVQDLANFHVEIMNNLVENVSIDQEKAVADLKETWGADYEKNLEIAKRAFKAFATPGDIEFINETGIGSFPPLIKLLARAGDLLQEHRFLGDASGGFISSDEARRKLDEIYSNRSHAYWSNDRADPMHVRAVEEVNRLIKIAEGIK